MVSSYVLNLIYRYLRSPLLIMFQVNLPQWHLASRRSTATLPTSVACCETACGNRRERRGEERRREEKVEEGGEAERRREKHMHGQAVQVKVKK